MPIKKKRIVPTITTLARSVNLFLRLLRTSIGYTLDGAEVFDFVYIL